MTLRIHFPWRLLVTVAAFAAFGAAVAFFVVNDFHGYAYHQYALHTIGAGLLGVLGWMLSGRIAHVANLNASPALRLIISSVPAICVAAVLVEPVIEFGVGTEVYWTEGVGVGLYVLAGIVPLLSGMALIAVLETLLAGRRGGSDWRSALRPVLPYAGFAIVLAAVTVFCVIELPADISEVVLAITPDRAQKSGWLERRRALFASTLSGAGCDVLVVPFEAAEPPGSMHSLDRPARSLITRYVAAEIAGRTGSCVADVTLVSRALDPRARRFDPREITKLAESIGARSIVTGKVALAEGRLAYDVTVAIRSRGAREKARWSAAEATEWGPVDFSDELPPEIAFQPLVPAVVEHLGFASNKAAPPEAAQSAGLSTLPEDLRRLSQDPGTPVARAQRLQLVALAHPRADVDSEHLWERSIVALAAVPADDEAARVLRARAALHLYRRPYAVNLLHGLGSAEALALYALAQGNLLEGEGLARQIDDPAAALMTAVELEIMRDWYQQTSGFRERRDALFQRYPAYAPLLYVTLSTDDWFQPAAHEIVRRQLDALGVAIQEDAPIAMVRLVARRFGLELFFSSDILRLPRAIEDSYAPTWRMHGATWRGQAAADRLAEWDLYDALYAANRAALVNSARSIGSLQDRQAAFLDFSRDLGQSFQGYPPFVDETTGVLDRMRSKRGPTPDPLLDRRQARLKHDLEAWEGGETELVFGDEGIKDEPMRPWRPTPYPMRNWTTAARQMDRATLAANAAHYLRVASFAQYHFQYLTYAHDLLTRSGQREQAEQIVAQAQQRFIGNPHRDGFLLERAEAKGDLPAYIALLEAKVREQPEDWATYYRLAEVQLQAREAQRAQRTVMSYPLFEGDKANPVEMSAHALSGGFLLLAAGYAELARPLFERSVQYQTGSGAEMWSDMALAQIDGDWGRVSQWGTHAYERYQDGWALSRAAHASLISGDQEQGLRAFYQASKQLEDMRPWNAAIAGQRIAATGDEELVAFAKRWKGLRGNALSDSLLRQHFLLNTLMIDRPPSDQAVATLQAVAAGGPVLKELAVGYNAFRVGNYLVAIDNFSVITKLATNKSENMKRTFAYPLPYYVASLARAGRAEQARAELASFQDRIGKDFYYLLAAAYLDGIEGQTQKALDSLWLAQFDPPDMAAVTFPPLFQHLETCEKLYELTGDDRFRKLLVDLAVRQQVSWPYSWSYAFEAKYAVDSRERERALGIALYLDPQSEHLAGFSAKDRRIAGEWFAKNNPFQRAAKKREGDAGREKDRA